MSVVSDVSASNTDFHVFQTCSNERALNELAITREIEARQTQQQLADETNNEEKVVDSVDLVKLNQVNEEESVIRAPIVHHTPINSTIATVTPLSQLPSVNVVEPMPTHVHTPAHHEHLHIPSPPSSPLPSFGDSSIHPPIISPSPLQRSNSPSVVPTVQTLTNVPISVLNGFHDMRTPPSASASEIITEDNARIAAAATATESEDEDAKRTVLLDIANMEKRGISMTKKWTMNDRLQDMLLEVRRHVLAEDEERNVNSMREGLRFVISGIELVNNRLGLLDLDGWSGQVSKELGKHDANLSRIYRKYWRRSSSRNPEMDIVTSIIASMGMHHMKRVMAKQVLGQVTRTPQTTKKPVVRRHVQDEDSSSDEEDTPAVEYQTQTSKH